MTDGIWLVSLVLGGTGGVLNAVLSDRARVLPSFVTLSPGRTRIVRIGILGNIVTGAATAGGLYGVIQLAGTNLATTSSFGLALLGFCDLFVAFLSARWLTNEVDKLVLRKAVFKAVSAPAAHPDAVGEMQMASPYALYIFVDRLLPRQARHR
jgi:hypothetical protein